MQLPSGGAAPWSQGVVASTSETVLAVAARSVPPDPDPEEAYRCWSALREAYLLAEGEAVWDEDRREALADEAEVEGMVQVRR